MKYNLFIIFHEFKPIYWQKRFKRDSSYFKKLSPNDSNLTILDLTKYCLFRSDKFYDHEDKDVNYIKIKSINELKKVLNKSQTNYALGPVYPSLNSILIFIIIKIFEIKIIMINRQGFFLNMQNKETNLINSLKFFFNHKLMYYFTRIFSIINILPKIEYYFETSQTRIDEINKSFLSRLNNFFYNRINFSYIKKIIRINSSGADEISLDSKVNSNYKNIVLVDSGYDHPDRFSRERIIVNHEYLSERNLYYKKLFKFLNDLSNLTDKKILFCKHPKNTYPLDGYFLKIEKNFCEENYLADNEIKKSYLTLFTGGSSMINKSIIFSNNIIILRSKLIGIHNILLDSFKKQIQLKEFDLDNNVLSDHVNIIKECEKIKLKYDDFINNNLIIKKNVKSYDQIKHVLYQ